MACYRPDYLLINWDKGEVVGSGDGDEVRDQLRKITESTHAFIIAKVEVLSEMKRVES
jgi:hypothetical protein